MGSCSPVPLSAGAGKWLLTMCSQHPCTRGPWSVPEGGFLSTQIHVFCFFFPREQMQGINPNFQLLDVTASLSSELKALNSSLVIINNQYQSKKTQFETSRSTDLSGTALWL